MMTFAIRNLSVLAAAQGFTAWHYDARKPYRYRDVKIEPQDLAAVFVPGFFSLAADMIAAGDTITVSATDGCAMLYVTAAADGDGVECKVMCRT